MNLLSVTALYSVGKTLFPFSPIFLFYFILDKYLRHKVLYLSGSQQFVIKHPVKLVIVLLNDWFYLFFSSCYFCLHIASILVLLVFPLKRTQKGNKQHESIQPVWSKKLEEENLLQKNSYSTTNNSFSQKEEITCRYQALKQWLRNIMIDIFCMFSETHF